MIPTLSSLGGTHEYSETEWNSHHFASDVFKYISINENYCIFTESSSYDVFGNHSDSLRHNQWRQ